MPTWIIALLAFSCLAGLAFGQLRLAFSRKRMKLGLLAINAPLLPMWIAIAIREIHERTNESPIPLRPGEADFRRNALILLAIALVSLLIWAVVWTYGLRSQKGAIPGLPSARPSGR